MVPNFKKIEFSTKVGLTALICQTMALAPSRQRDKPNTGRCSDRDYAP